ncbi:MAG: glycosyltransferase family 9 protein [Chthoniobacterales bacterium]|nr:glycosyltransferase family 9 protein [Chthoniobacterales bacterium]MCX7712130.1 glycosyltransferase family 9 protein [Chthoniobacterales bacterium]
MASFFGRKTELCQDLCKYFASFDLIISYLFDPDGIFLENLKQAGAKKVINGPWKPNESSHAILQLAKPLSELGAEIKDITIRIYPTPADLEAATSHLPVLRNKEKCIVIHPGSGAERKNWPIESWAILSERLLNAGWKLIFTGGEADHKKLDYLSDKLAKTEKIFFLKNQPLPVVAGALKLAGNYLGHDTGISHLAAGAGCKSILFFGPTNPEVWAPPNTGTRILRPASGNLHDLDIEEVWSSVLQWY